MCGHLSPGSSIHRASRRTARRDLHVQPQELPLVQQEVLALARQHYDAALTMGSLERYAFYVAARNAFAVVATGHQRPYGCFLIKKGVIFG